MYADNVAGWLVRGSTKPACLKMLIIITYIYISPNMVIPWSLPDSCTHNVLTELVTRPSVVACVTVSSMLSCSVFIDVILISLTLIY